MTLLEIRRREQVAHHLLDVHAVGPRLDHQSNGIFMIGFVPDVGDHRQLLRQHLRRDLLENPAAGYLIREGLDDDVAGEVP